MVNSKKIFELSSAALHILAMIFMLCDHIWATVYSNNILTCIGRMAFPIFAFLIVEGYYHTKSYKKYLLRLLLLAIVSEIPFNLMYGGTLFYPIHQNVIWTFLIALIAIYFMDKISKKCNVWLSIIINTLIVLIGMILGFATFSDYYGLGVLTVIVFYLFYRYKDNNVIERLFKNYKYKKELWIIICFIGQILCLYYINVELLGGLYYPVEIFGFKFELVQQGLALLSLIPIWLYRGYQGYSKKWFKYFCYSFYPLHCLILGLIAMR